jgi:acetoin utilization deacetylase AcuC-like enzyme
MLIISAGFDAHKSDPLGGINLSAKDFSYMTSHCLKIQPNILLGLEGGYNLDALKECSVAVVNELIKQKRLN